jgi:hypothetical protein
VFYRENTVSIELFHALTDGHGTLTVLTALIREYLRLLGEDVGAETLGVPQPEEVEDAYEAFRDTKPRRLPSRSRPPLLFSFFIPADILSLKKYLKDDSPVSMFCQTGRFWLSGCCLAGDPGQRQVGRIKNFLQNC